MKDFIATSCNDDYNLQQVNNHSDKTDNDNVNWILKVIKFFLVFDVISNICICQTMLVWRYLPI